MPAASTGLAAALGNPGPPPAVAGYEILGLLGRGGMGVVYRARQVALGRVVALKMILAGRHARAEELARFQAEAEAVARLQHPNIVQVHEVGQAEGAPFFSLEYLEGGSLEQKLAGTPLEARASARLVEVLARAAHFAHERGIVHRDLKPANVLLAADGTPKVTDFGLARRLDEAGGTASGAVLGTPSYMAPEQASGKGKEAGPAADVYALGAILYECLTGRPPFKGETSLDTLSQVVVDEPVAPSRLRPRLPRDLEVICLKCLQKSPAARYASAEALADDLARFLDGRPILARPTGALERVGKFARRNKALVGATSAVFLALVLGVIGTSIGLVRARADRALARQAEAGAVGDRDRAQEAEGDARRLLAESYAQSARLAMQRGAWREALAELDKALGAGHTNEAALRFDRVRALAAIHDVPRAVAEVEALARRSDLGDLEGRVLLWRGDLTWEALCDLKALELVKQASRKKKLPLAEQAYARGLLAKTSPAAARAFREALEHDPFHFKANAMLCSLLLMLGQLDEAREQLRFSRRLYPEDPTVQVQRAFLAALEGDRARANALLKKAEGQVGKEPLATARALVDLFLHVHEINRGLDGDPNASDELSLMPKLLPAMSRLAAVQKSVMQERRPSSADFLLHLPPVFVKACRPLRGLNLPEMTAALLVGGPFVRGPAQRLKATSDVHPEGVLLLLRGLLLVQARRWAEAEEAFLAASTTPSIAHVHKPALVWALTCQRELARKPGMKKKALETTRKLVERGGAGPDHAGALVAAALAGGDLDLARAAVAQWERQAGRGAALDARLAVEFVGQAYGRVLTLARQAPGDPVAARWEARARARILEQARALTPGPGAGPAPKNSTSAGPVP
jgi:tetratricopeptide (TPR) repeat protein